MRSGADIIAGLIFGLVALIHLARILCPFDVIVQDTHVPDWASAVGFVVAGLLSAWLFRPKIAKIS